VKKILSVTCGLFNKLKDVNEAVKPLGCAQLTQKATQTALIFPRVDSRYQLGVPSDERQFVLYIQKLKEVIKKIHAAAVVHIDLYPSNIFWAFEENNITIQLIDWDSATLIGDYFTESMSKAMKSHKED
jgi:serine/threonine protein kinase